MENPNNTALILIDIQKAFDDIDYWGGERNNLQAEQNCRMLLDYWRLHHLPIFHIQHCSTNIQSRLAVGNPGNGFKDIVKPTAGEVIIQKSVNSAFIETDLKKQLDDLGINALVIGGLTTDHCVSTTTRMAGNYGYETYLISDATATFPKNDMNGRVFSAEIIHSTALASLRDEFATIIKTEEIICLMDTLKLRPQNA